MTNTTAPAALPARPARAPRGFVAADRCGTCDGRGAHLVPAVDGDGEFVLDGEGFEVEVPTTCEDCEGRGWARDERTPEQVRAEAEAAKAERIADHLAFVAEFGYTPGRAPSCGGNYCRCER